MKHRTCSHPNCSKPHQARGLCGGHYAAKYYPDRHAPKKRICQQCGDIYKTSRHNGKYCSYDCRTVALKAQKKGPYRPRPEPVPPPTFRIWVLHCAQCGTQYNAPVKGRRKYCSDRCLWLAKYYRDRQRAGLPTAQDHEALERTGATCGQVFTSPYPNAAYCRSGCRPRLGGHWISPERRSALYERDGHRCYLCGNQVASSGDVNADNYATLDHVVPRAHGGTDDDNNLMTCCRKCNSVKSDNVYEWNRVSLL